MASFTPVDVVRLAAVSRLRVSDEDLQPVADALIIHLASAEPMLRADPPRCQSRSRLPHRVHHQGEEAQHQ